MLFNCSRCGKLISSHAENCPYCETALTRKTASRQVFHPYFTRQTSSAKLTALTMSFVNRVRGR